MTHVKNAVLKFYQELPFNYYGDMATACSRIRKSNMLEYYPDLVPCLKQGVSLLDVGCGEGWLVNSANYYYHDDGCVAHGMDFNAAVIEQAQRIAQALNVAVCFRTADIFEYIPERPYDVVVSMGVLHHTESCERAIRHIAQHYVNTGGFFYLGLYHRYGRRPFLDYFKHLAEQGDSEETLFQAFVTLRGSSGDETHDRSWFRDQVLHPHETQHTLEELVPLFEQEGLRVISTSLNRFQPFHSLEDLYRAEQQTYEIGQKRLDQKKYYPGFFTVKVQKHES